MATSESGALAMYFTVSDHYGTPYFSVRVVRIEEGSEMMPNGEMAPTIRNLSDEDLADLTIYTMGGSITYDGPARTTYGPYVEFETSRVGLRDAERMVTVLKKINRALERAEAQDGSAAHLGQTMLRVARALGITKAVKRVDSNGQRASMFSQMRFRTTSLANLSDHISYTLREYVERGEVRAA